MILNATQENKATLSGVSAVSSFSIKASAKAFDILSSGLYANKIRAIVRELSCNAYDSHVAAGKGSVPFEVHLPNQYETYFSVKDFGVGLSHEDVVNIYTKYFESTKTDSNDYVGALGLGSKSPFSYTDNFSIIAVKDGICGIYSAFVNDEGVPSVALLSTSRTTEPNGVEVKLTVVNRDDMYKFQNEAVEIFTWFKYQPTVKGWSGFTVRLEEKKALYKPKYIDEKLISNIRISDCAQSNQSKPMAIMGNIAYPIDMPNIEKNLGSLGRFLTLNDGYYGYNKQILLIDFAIGEIEFQASREGLSYTKATIEGIKNKLQVLEDNLYTSFELMVSQQDQTSWEFPKWIKSMADSHLWKEVVIVWLQVQKNPNIWCTHRNGNLHFNQFNLNPVLLAEANLVQVHLNKNTDNEVSPLNNNVIVLNDTKYGSKTKFNRYLKSTKRVAARYYLLDKLDKNKPILFDKLVCLLNQPPTEMFVNLSSLSIPKTERTAFYYVKKPPTFIRLKELVSGSARRRQSFWDDSKPVTKEEFNKMNSETQYYIPLNDAKAPVSKVFDAYLFTNSFLTKIFDTLNFLTKVKFYGILKSDLTKIGAFKNWVNVEDYITEHLRVFKDKYQVCYVASNRSETTLPLRKFLSNTKVTEYFPTFVNNEGVFWKFVKDFGYNKDITTLSTHFFGDIASKYIPGYMDSFKKFSEKDESGLTEILKTYPMLFLIHQYSNYFSYSEILNIFQYIDLIDKTNKTTGVK